MLSSWFSSLLTGARNVSNEQETSRGILQQQHHFGDLPPEKLEGGLVAEDSDEDYEDEDEQVTTPRADLLNHPDDENDEDDDDDEDVIDETLFEDSHLLYERIQDIVKHNHTEPKKFSIDIKNVIQSILAEQQQQRDHKRDNDEAIDEILLVDKKYDFSSPHVIPAPENVEEKRHQDVLSHFPVEWPLFYNIQKRLLSPYLEMTEEDLEHLSQNFTEQCKFREIHCLPLELSTSLFVVNTNHFAKWVNVTSMQLELSIPLSALATDELARKNRENDYYYSISLADLICDKSISSNFDRAWLISLQVLEGSCNFSDTFQIATSLRPDMWITTVPCSSSFTPLTQQKENVQQDETPSTTIRMATQDRETLPFFLRFFGGGHFLSRPNKSSRHPDIKRNIMWGIYVAGLEESYFRKLALKTPRGKCMWRRTISTCTIMQTIMESKDQVTDEIYQMVYRILEGCSFDYFKFEVHEFELLMDFLRPLLTIQSLQSIHLYFQRFDEKQWSNISSVPTDSKKMEIKLCFSMEARVFRDAPPSTVEIEGGFNDKKQQVDYYALNSRNPLVAAAVHQYSDSDSTDILGTVVDRVASSMQRIVESSVKEDKKD